MTAGHSTVMATVQFFGWEQAQVQAKTAAAAAAAAAAATAATATENGETKGDAATSVVPRNWAPSSFDSSSEYCFQDALVTPKEGAKLGQYALLEFDTPLITPIGSIIIASRLDTENTTETCRLVFHGKILNNMQKSDSNIAPGSKTSGAVTMIGGGEYKHPYEFIHIYKHKAREGTIMRIKSGTDVIINGMFAKDSDLTRFLGMTVVFELSNGQEMKGRIEGKFGSSGKLVITGVDSSQLKVKQTCYLRFKKYIFDSDKKAMHPMERKEK